MSVRPYAAEPSPAVVVEAGHAKVRRTIEGEVITYDISSPGSWADWLALACMPIFWARIVISATGTASWSWCWLYNVVILFFGMVTFCISIAFMWRPSVRLTPERLRVRELSGLGWRTREFATGADVVVRRACHNNGRGDIVSIVISSQGQDVEFGRFFGKDIVAFLIAAIQDYYNSDAAPAPTPIDDIAFPSWYTS
jgi:hypothetical protein